MDSGFEISVFVAAGLISSDFGVSVLEPSDFAASALGASFAASASESSNTARSAPTLTVSPAFASCSTKIPLNPVAVTSTETCGVLDFTSLQQKRN